MLRSFLDWVSRLGRPARMEVDFDYAVCYCDNCHKYQTQFLIRNEYLQTTIGYCPECQTADAEYIPTEPEIGIVWGRREDVESEWEK